MRNVPKEAPDPLQQPAFAIDHQNRIVSWNDACSEQFGIDADHALGKRCYDLLAGRDLFGNVHCYRSCPISHQVREMPNAEVHPFIARYRNSCGEYLPFVVEPLSKRRTPAAAPVVVHTLTPAVLKGEMPTDVADEAIRQATEGMESDQAAGCEQTQEVERLLTPREREILGMLDRGEATEVIASTLSISRVTVRNHVQRILAKLGVHNRLAATARFRGIPAGASERHEIGG
ncbi:MAG: LuxR C-terminal-related transcriptional regulator [Thermoanaerobaculia bacterium]